ncbi:MAG: hypothetical protein RLZZ502_1699 [Pseudomonadota bacterium]|jgi:carboxyl-terminal processing protease
MKYLRWLLVLLLLGCQTLDPHNIIGRRISPDKEQAGTLTQAQRHLAFEQLADTIDRYYLDPTHHGVDWRGHVQNSRRGVMDAVNEDEFWLAMDRMLGVLADAHTRVASPKQVARLQAQEIDPLGISLMRLADRFYLRSVHPNSDFAWVGARPGQQVLAINNEDIGAVFARRLSATKASSTAWTRERVALREMLLFEEQVALRVQHHDGSHMVVHGKGMKLNQHHSAMHRVLPGNVGYLRWSGFSLSLEAAVLKGIDELKETKGLIIDLRNNGGGALAMVKNVAEQFFVAPTHLAKIETRSGRPVRLLGLTAIEPTLEVRGRGNAYQAPIIILMNEASASASEAFAGGLQAVGRARVMGQTSCGCLLGYLGTLKLSGGGELAYSEIGFKLANGDKVEGRGIVPDLPRPLLVQDLQVQRDRVLEEALSILAGH